MKNLVCFLFLSCSTLLLAQGPEPYEVRRESYISKNFKIDGSVDPVNLGRYGDFEINHYNGSLQLHVPLYELPAKWIDLPISLLYNGQGSRLFDEGGYVGLNWALRAGGVITRQVQGFPDFVWNYYQHQDTLMNPQTYTNLFKENYLLEDIAKAEIESQPDHYYANFLGYAFKFYIAPNRQVYMAESQDLDIELDWDNNEQFGPDLMKIIIRDTKGNSYHFETIEFTQQYKDDGSSSSWVFSEARFVAYHSSWFLTKIVSGVGNEVIDFEYHTAPSAPSKIYHTPPYSLYQYNSRTHSEDNTSSCNACSKDPDGRVSFGGPDDLRVYKRRHLKKISYQKNYKLVESIEFTSSNHNCPLADATSRKLDKITIKRHAGTQSTTLLSFDFVYDCSSNRLTLQSITERGKDGTSKPPWEFEYNSTPLPNMSLPSHFVKMDSWSFYNNNSATIGAGSTPSLIPHVHTTANTYGDGANRQSDFGRTKAGILEKVTYPTGGYTEYEYEANSVASFLDHTLPSGQSTTAGGLRVASITHSDSDDTPLLKRTYKYRLGNSNNNSSGKLLQRIHYLQLGSFTNCTVDQLGCPVTTTCNTFTVLASPLPINSGGSSNNVVGYSRVEEITSEPSGGSATAGKTVYFFHNEEISSDYDVIENGQLYRKEVYDADDKLLVKTETAWSTDLPAQSTLPRYKAFPKFKVVAKAAQDTKTYLCQEEEGVGNPVWKEFEYTGSCFISQLFPTKYRRDEHLLIEQKWAYRTGQSETRYFYDSNGNAAGEVLTTTDYVYGDTLITLPTETIVTNSNGEVFKTVNAYIGQANANLSIYENMQMDYQYAFPLFTEHYIDNNLVYKSRYDYSFTNGGELPTELYETFNAEPERLAESFDLRDNAGNLRLAYRTGQEPNMMIYSNYLCRASARVQNGKYNEVAYTSFDTPDTIQGYWALSAFQLSDFKQSPTEAYSGTGYFLPAGSASIVKNNVPAGKYRLSYARKGAVSVGLTGGVVVHSQEAPPNAKGWRWTVVTILLTGSSNTISLSLSNTPLDELRLHPIDALMNTASYDRSTRLLDGLVDESGIPSQISYDDLLRPIAFKNFDKHFLQQLKYEYEADAGIDKNAVKTQTVFLEGITTSSGVDALLVNGGQVQPFYEYFDGLGRSLQSIGVGQSPSLKDIVSPSPYDEFGRQVDYLLPYTISNNGSYRPNALAEQQAFCSAQFGSAESNYGLMKMELEASPLNRVFKEKPPGVDFASHPSETTYGTNAANEVRNFHTSSAWLAANELYKVTQSDENGNQIITYTDKLHRVVMQDREGRKTYFLYNGTGQQEQVITPEGAKLGHNTPSLSKTSPSIAEKSYLYTYDSRYRMSSKKVPGAETYYYYYDELDQVVLMKNGNGFQTFTKYDALLRPIMTGKYKGTSLPNIAQSTFEQPSTTGPHYYTTNQSFPTDGNIDIYTVNYYDDYNFDNNTGQSAEATYESPSADASDYPSSNYPFAGAKLTGTKTAILNKDGSTPSTFLDTYTFYDKFGRIIHTQTDNHLGGRDVEWNSYNYPGWLLKSRKEHDAVTSAGNQSLTISQRFTYDHTGREKLSYYELNDSGNEQLLCEKSYNERDELQSKKIGGTSADGYLQTLNYSYNIRRWLTHINDVHNQGSDLFAMELIYGEGETSFFQLYLNGANANYNGNITMMKWSGAGSDKQVYGFLYDKLNRVTLAAYGEEISTNNYTSNQTYLGVYSYDDNGNIKTITRNSVTGNDMDDMSLSYFGDGRLQKVTELGDKARGFVTKNTGNLNYDYDLNGNLTKDPDKACAWHTTT